MVAIAAALPWIGSAIGMMLPTIVDAFRSGKSPEEAAKIIAPKRQEIVDRLVGSGMNQSAAEAMADQSMEQELAQAQLPEPMSPWLSMGLAAAGAFAGYKGGAMLGKKFPAKKMDAPPAPPVATPAAGPTPEFLPGEMPPAKRASKDLRPWEDMPEVKRVMDEKAAGGPFPNPRKPGEAFNWADGGSMRKPGEAMAWAKDPAARPEGPFGWADAPQPLRAGEEWAAWSIPPTPPPSIPKTRLLELVNGAEPTMQERMAQAMFSPFPG